MKYVITNEKREFCGRIVWRIQRISDGKLGGWIETDKNLSQDGDCFVYDDAIVCEHAVVKDDAEVSGFSVVRGTIVVGGSNKVSSESRDEVKVVEGFDFVFVLSFIAIVVMVWLIFLL